MQFILHPLNVGSPLRHQHYTDDVFTRIAPRYMQRLIQMVFVLPIALLSVQHYALH